MLRALLFVALVSGCGPVTNSPDASVDLDAGVTPTDAGTSVDAGSDAGSSDAGAAVCSGTGACVTLNENQCGALEAGQGGCTRRFAPRCVERGTCTNQSMSTCASAGACRWTGTTCVAEACGAMTTETDCLALRCTWATLYAGCNGSTYDCDLAARTLSPATPAQACSGLQALGLSCHP